MKTPPFVLWRACALLVVIMLATGCVTQLGYVPSYVKGATSEQAPNYSEVRAWAVDVRNGYDTRMTMNRYSGYWGAGVAAAAAGTMTGLAAFDAGSSALVGIPIGTAFLGAIAGFFQNEDKARVYGHASRYTSDLITGSDNRIDKRMEADARPDLALSAAMARKAAVDEELRATRARLDAIRAKYKTDQDAILNQKDPDIKKALEDQATATAKVVVDTEKAVTEAEGKGRRAERAVAIAQARNAKGPQPRDRQAAEKSEAVCLQQDVIGVMAKVAELLFPLDPDAAKLLKAVHASDSNTPVVAQKPASAAPASTADTKPADKPPVLDTKAFELPARSVCDDDVVAPVYAATDRARAADLSVKPLSSTTIRVGGPPLPVLVTGGTPPYTVTGPAAVAVDTPGSKPDPSGQSEPYIFKLSLASGARPGEKYAVEVADANGKSRKTLDVTSVRDLVVRQQGSTPPQRNAELVYLVTGGTPPYTLVGADEPSQRAVSVTPAAGRLPDDNPTFLVKIAGTATAQPVRIVVNDAAGMPAFATFTVAGEATSPTSSPLVAIGNILFDFDDATIKPSEHSKIVEVARLMKETPGMIVRLAGHADPKGARAHNAALSARRAKSVTDALVTLGIAPANIQTAAEGADRPVCREATEECHARDRRVEVLRVVSQDPAPPGPAKQP